MANFNSKNALLAGLKGDSVFIRYSAHADGTDFSEEWSGQGFIGIATGQRPPTDKAEYTWHTFDSKNVSALPEVTEADNGKIPVVSDGEWTADFADSELSETSEKPVQNKVVAAALAAGTSAIVTLQENLAKVDSRVPAVSYQEEQRILEVVGGKWTAVSISQSSVKKYIDNYIAEALGGEY